MKIAIYGAGAIGGYFGIRMAQAGHEVHFICRGEHLAHAKQHGLTLKSVAGDAEINPAMVTDDIKTIGPCDSIFICVKSWQLGQIDSMFQCLLHANTLIIPLLNSINARELLLSQLKIHSIQHDPSRILMGLCRIIARISTPGVIEHLGVNPSIEFNDTNDEAIHAAQLLQDLGELKHCRLSINQDIRAALWKKLLFVTPLGAIGALTRANIGVIRNYEPTREILLTAIREFQQVALSQGVDIKERDIDKTMAAYDGLPEESTASMQRDLMAGKPSELYEQVGAIVALAQTRGLQLPILQFAFDVLSLQELKARQPS